MTHNFPSVAEVLEIHASSISKFGGTPGIRDRGALESALGRLQSGYYPSLAAEAAAFMESLANNHPFIDGNKRVAFFATETFLSMNGYFIECDDDEAYGFFMHLFDTNSFRFAALLLWLEEHIKPLPQII